MKLKIIFILFFLMNSKVHSENICQKYLLGQITSFNSGNGGYGSGLDPSFLKYFQPTPNIKTYDKNIFHNLFLLNTNNNKNNNNTLIVNQFINQKINAIPRSIQAGTNLASSLQNGQQSAPVRPTVVEERGYSYFVYDTEKGLISVFNSRTQQTSQITLMDLISMYQIETTYFPFIFDSNQPTILIFGIGNGAIGNRSIGFQPLMRNGGHRQLVTAYRGTLLPSLNGLYGGGFRINQGQIVVEFQSRGVNAPIPGTVDGRLDKQVTDTLSPLVQAIVLKALTDSVDLNNSITPVQEVPNPVYSQPATLRW